MPVPAYRVCRRIYARLDGEGSRKVGGQWNSSGGPVVYMAQSVALAVLENLVHMSREDYPVGYVVVDAIVPDRVRILDHLHFLDFRVGGAMRERKTGDEWLASSKSAVLRVPSAVVQAEWNYLISPQHLHSARIVVHGARLLKQLDQNGFPVESMLWAHLSDEDYWRLIIASPVVSSQGSGPAYRLLHEILQKLQLAGLNLEDISLLDPESSQFRYLLPVAAASGRLATGPEWIEFEDAIVYRWTRAFIGGTLNCDASAGRPNPILGRRTANIRPTRSTDQFGR